MDPSTWARGTMHQQSSQLAISYCESHDFKLNQINWKIAWGTACGAHHSIPAVKKITLLSVPAFLLRLLTKLRVLIIDPSYFQGKKRKKNTENSLARGLKKYLRLRLVTLLEPQVSGASPDETLCFFQALVLTSFFGPFLEKPNHFCPNARRSSW